jgi:hypothetical protein
MKPQIEIKKLLPAVAFIAIFSLWGAASAQASPEPHLRSGMFGCATGQVARINAVNIGDPNTRPIQVEMLFLDGTGAVVGRDMQTIAPGQAVFLNFVFDPGREENRIELRAIVSVLGGPDTKDLQTTVETFDAETGRNTVFIGDPGL